jgi:hypothetical protein
MMEKMKQHFLSLGPRRFVIGAVIALIILDLVNTVYLRLYWLVHQMILKNGYTLENFSSDTILEMKGFIDHTFYFFLFLMLVNNLFFYTFYLRKKLWAQGYVLFYTLTAAILGLSFIFEGVNLGWWWLLYNCATIPVYVYLYFGVKVLKYQTTDATPERGK